MKIDDSNNIIHLNSEKSKRKDKSAKARGSRGGHYPKIIAITSGKGGVGKTNIVANLGCALGNLGKNVLIFDADLGLGNLDVLLGLTPKFNLSHVIQGQKQLSEIVISGPGRLKILPAASGIQEMTALTHQERYQVFKQLDEYINGFDVMLIDTAAGISSNVMYFNINADEILVVATPDPTSITDAYALMKVLSVKYGTAAFKLVVNAAASIREADEVYRQLELVSNRFLTISIEYLGSIMLDENVKKGVRQQKIVYQMAPYSKASRGFAALARKIAGGLTTDGSGRVSQWILTDIPV